MNKGLILYRSKYGATKGYVDMMRENLDCDIYESRNWGEVEQDKYEWIIFAGGIYAGKIAGLQDLRKKVKFSGSQKLAVFCVGASPFDEKAFAEIKMQNLKEELENVPVFYGRGVWDESRMNWLDRSLCKMLKKAVEKKSGSCEPWMKELISSAGQKCDWRDRKYLQPLLEYIQS